MRRSVGAVGTRRGTKSISFNELGNCAVGSFGAMTIGPN